jgi:hypothetical protein
MRSIQKENDLNVKEKTELNLNAHPSIYFIVKACLVYGGTALAFSMLGTILPGTFVIGSPFEVSTITPEHIIGHIVWGLIPGLAFLSLRYIILAGLFPIILDADHLLQFLEIEMIPRMAHSMPFILIVIVVMMLLFGKKDLRLIAVSIAAVFSHMSFDTFLTGTTQFPVLAPFTSQFFTFSGVDWIIFQVLAVVIIITASVIVKKNYSRYNFKQKFYSI